MYQATGGQFSMSLFIETKSFAINSRLKDCSTSESNRPSVFYEFPRDVWQKKL